MIPLLGSATGPGQPPRGALVTRLDLSVGLDPLLRNWPVPSDSGETELWRREGDTLVALSAPAGAAFASDAAGAAGAALRLRLGEVDPRLASVFAGPAGSTPVTLRGLAHRGRQVSAALAPVPGTDWWLLARLDQAEIDAPARTTAAWAIGTAALALLALGIAARLFVQRTALHLSEAERARQAQQLASLRLLQAIADNSEDAIFAKDTEGRYLFYNRAACAEIGTTPEAVLGLDDTALFSPEVAAQLRANDREVITTGVSHTFEERLNKRSGERVNLSIKGPLRDEQGRVIGLFGISRDVTLQRRGEQALRDSEAQLRSVVTALHEGVLVFDRGGRVLWMNPSAMRILGFEGAPGASPAWSGFDVGGWAVLDADGRPMPLEQRPAVQSLTTGRPVHGAELRSRGPQGQERWFSINTEPVIDAATGRPGSVVVSLSDITERRRLDDELARHRDRLEALVAERTTALQRANDQLARAEDFLRTVADNLPGRIAYWDRALVCRFVNRGWCEWFGIPADQAVGRSAAELMGADYFGRFEPRLRAVLAGEPQRFERESRRDDTDCWHLVHYVPDRQADGSVAGFYALAFEITLQKRAEAGLQHLNAELREARDRAEDANRAKSAFLANMSHEIRTPMNAIIGLAHLVRRELRDAQQGERLDKISHSAQHLLQVINDILDLSKIEAGRLELEQIGFSLDAVLARCFEMVAEAARAKGLELVVDTDGLPDHLVGDPTRLAQALLNLLSNAVKFTERGFVRLQGELLAHEGNRVQLRFTVQDTGIGIAPNRLGALFGAFEQLDSSTSRRHGGTGLGLALTRRLAERMGGEAGVASEPGVGSRFWFSAWFGRVPDAVGEHHPLAGRGALLVDDLPEARSALGDRLRLFGMQVHAAASCDEALERARRAMAQGEALDIALIDWRMTPVDGVQTLHRLRAMLGEGTPPAVLVTAYDDERVRRDAHDARFAAVLTKPVTASTLLDTLLRLLAPAPPGAPAPVAEGGRGAAESRLRATQSGARLLLAEDNVVNQEVALALLRAAGLHVDLAENGEQAVAMALREPYDAVLMDMQMPGVDGLEATRQLRAAGFRPPVLAMTANAYGEDREACLAAGMDDHVAKPVDPEALYAALLRWLPPRDGPAAPPAGEPDRPGPPPSPR